MQDRTLATRPFLAESDVSGDEDQTYDADEDDYYYDSSDDDGALYQHNLTSIATDDEDDFVSISCEQNQQHSNLYIPSPNSLECTHTQVTDLDFSDGGNFSSDSGKELVPSSFTHARFGGRSPTMDRCRSCDNDEHGGCSPGSRVEEGPEGICEARSRQHLACLPLSSVVHANEEPHEAHASLDPTLAEEYGGILPRHYRDHTTLVGATSTDLPLDVAWRVPLGAYQFVRSLSVNSYTQVVAAESSTGEQSPDGYGPAPSKIFGIKIYFKNRTLASGVGIPPSGRLESTLQMKNEIRALKRLSQYSHRDEFVFVQQVDAVLEDQVRVFFIQVRCDLFDTLFPSAKFIHPAT